MYDSVLIPTDGGEHSIRAAEHGLSLARTFDATAHVVSALDVQGAAGVFDAGGVTEEFVERLESEAESAIESVEAAADADDSIRTATVRGRPSEAILEYAEENGIDVIAMGTHGRTGLARYLTGSVTERVVRLAPVPVLTARATQRSRRDGDYEEILVPTDGSDPAMAAVEHALAIAERVGARIHAVNVVNVRGAAVSPNDTPSVETMDHLESEGEAITERIAARARDRGLDATTEVREGVPTSDLLEYADENGIDLIAMGTTGRTGLKRVVLGNTAERMIRHADAPVLAVKARERDAE